MASESNAIASNNGIEMENIIKALYPGAEFRYRGVIDFSIDGVQVEVKSCQEQIQDNYSDKKHKGKPRSGRFNFSDLQHQTLLENNGEYIFLVHREGIPHIYVRVPAVKLNLGKFSGVKAVCWKTIIRGAVA